MRFLVTGALVLACGVAHASSITPVVSHGGNGSMVTKSCGDCPPPKAKEGASAYTVPLLEHGPQRVEIVEVNGEKKLLRTNAWLGGSPVVHVSKVHDWMSGTTPAATGTAGDGVDHHTLVGAVEAGSPEIAAASDPAPLNLDMMQLRLR